MVSVMRAGKEPFLLMATAVLERCAATEVLAEALEHQDIDHLGAAIMAGEVVLKNIDRHVINRICAYFEAS